MKIPRPPAVWRRFRSWMTGWFWAPCPGCGRHFSGYERRAVAAGDGTCGRCP